jgi:hypothetical protein
MGYRSQIGGVFSVDMWVMEPVTQENKDFALSKYKEMIGLIKLSKFYELMQQSELDRKCIGWKAGEFYFCADQWKWYPDYDIVQAWDNLWEQMQEVEGVSGYFCRVGEEVNDIEQESFGDEPDYDAFQWHQYLDCGVDKSVFGGGDIDKEINLTMLEGETI